MSPKRPYLLKAFYDWLIDNQDAPFILVDAEGVIGSVPVSAVNDGKVALNISANAVEHLDIGIESISFNCRFNGTSAALRVPMSSIFSIYGRECGQGLVFDKEEYEKGHIRKESDKSESKLRLV